MMAESNKTKLPKRQYYSLQQAADELNRHHKVENNENPIIDVDYLLHLGANRLIRLYVPIRDEVISIDSRGGEENLTLIENDKECLSYATEVLGEHYFEPMFFLVEWDNLSEIEFNKKSDLYTAPDILIHVDNLKIFPIVNGKGRVPFRIGNTHLCPTSKLIFENGNFAYISLNKILSAIAFEYEKFDPFFNYYIEERSHNLNPLVVDRDLLLIFIEDMEGLKNGEVLNRENFPDV